MFARWICLTGALACLASFAWASDSPRVTLSPELRALIAEVQGASPRAKAAETAVQAMRARLDAAKRPVYNPEFAIDAERSDVSKFAVGVNQAVDVSAKGVHRLRVAEAELNAALAEAEMARREVAVATLGALAAYHQARQSADLARRRLELMTRFAQTAEQRAAAGDIERLDVNLARLAVAEARLRYAQAQTTLADAEVNITAVTGRDQREWPALPLDRSPPAFPGDIDVIVDRLPSLAAYRQRVEADRARVGVARSERRPDPTLGVRGGTEDGSPLVGVSISLPLYVRNPYMAEVEAARQDALQSEQLYLDARRRTRARLEGAYANFRTVVEAWRDWRASGEAAAAEQAELLERLWRAGELSASDYLIQAKQSIETQMTATDLAGRFWSAWVAWLEASGGIDAVLNPTNDH